MSHALVPTYGGQLVARMADVAARAGVSQRTVSNVVRGYRHVRPETRERVQRALDELKYRPNASARSLRQGRTGIIALAVPYIAAPYFAELADLIQQSAASRDITLLMDQTGADRDRELLVLDGYRTHVIDGLILSPMAMTALDLREQALDMPTVLLGERIRRGSLVNVAIDNVAASREAVKHLLDSGRRRVAVIGADVMTNRVGAAEGRLAGYHVAHQEAGIEVAAELVLTTDGWFLSSGYAAANSLLRSDTAVDALFCMNDLLAFGAIRALSEHGLAVPDDVCVMGWDDIEEARYSTPSLSSVSPDKAAIAAAAVDRLCAQITGLPVLAEEVICDYKLVIRESTTCRA